MDVKAGSGAFMPTFEKSVELARSIVEVANGAGCRTTALVTNMDQVLASSAGNAVEVAEAVRYLQGHRPNARLHEVTMALTAQMLLLGGVAESEEEAMRMLEEALESGKAAEIFGRMVAALGGPADFMERYEAYLPKAPIVRPIYPEKEGIVEAMDTRAIGLAVVAMGGGRTKPTDAIDHAVGFSGFAVLGDEVGPRKPLAVAHVQSEAQFEEAQRRLREAIRIGRRKYEKRPMILKKISPEV